MKQHWRAFVRKSSLAGLTQGYSSTRVLLKHSVKQRTPLERTRRITPRADLVRRCALVLAAARKDTENASIVTAAASEAYSKHRIARLEARVAQLEEQLAGYDDMANCLRQCALVASNEPAPDSPAQGSAPWFSDPSLDLPFALPSVMGSGEEAEQMSIGEVLVRDFQTHDYETISRRYEAQQVAEHPAMGGGDEAETIGGLSWHGGLHGGVW